VTWAALFLLAALPEAVLLDVTFLPQGRLLCGGASAAMVLRYWGAEDVYAEDFQELVDEDEGGISTADLEAAVRARDWRAMPLRADRETVRRYLSSGRPLIALLRSSERRFHYVVLTGYSGDDLVLHDPSLGPNRLRSFDSVFESWAASHVWALLVTPRESLPAKAEARASAPQASGEALVLRERAAARFLEEEWSQAASLAAAALELAPEDDHARSIFAASLYLSGDRERALEAWNAGGKPKLDRVEIRGLARTRQEVLYRYLDVSPGEPLTAEELRKAQRRVSDLPTLERARVSYEPLGEARAKLVASLAERSRFEPLPSALLRGTVEALVYRTIRGGLSSPTGGGESIEGGFRWWEERPKLWVSLAAPELLSLPGIGSLEGYFEQQSYALPGSAPVEESWRGARLSAFDWVSSGTRAGFQIGFHEEDSAGSWIALGGGIERRIAGDRVSLRADAVQWLATGDAASFREAGASAAARLVERQSWSLRARLDARLVTENAPLTVWPGAGSDNARPLLLRGYPLLEEGVLRGKGFGPKLLHASVEIERTLWNPGMVKLGLATFVDWARVYGRDGESPGSLWSPGAGLRVDLFGRTLRLDAATALGRGGLVVSAGWLEEF
jgi:predicted double-glycine peptidase